MSGIILSRPVWLKKKSISPMEVLPEILKVTAGEIPVLVEMDHADMTDVFTAIALGTDAVCSDLSHMDSTVIWKRQKEEGSALADQEANYF